jgi:hypothetical protein
MTFRNLKPSILLPQTAPIARSRLQAIITAARSDPAVKHLADTYISAQINQLFINEKYLKLDSKTSDLTIIRVIKARTGYQTAFSSPHSALHAPFRPNNQRLQHHAPLP